MEPTASEMVINPSSRFVAGRPVASSSSCAAKPLANKTSGGQTKAATWSRRRTALILISTGKEQRVKAESHTGGFPSLGAGGRCLRARSTSPVHQKQQHCPARPLLQTQAASSQLYNRCIFEHKVRFCNSKSSTTPVIFKRGDKLRYSQSKYYERG